MAPKPNLASSKSFGGSTMKASTHVLRTRVDDRSVVDPYAAILPEVAEPKLVIILADEEDDSVPLRSIQEQKVKRQKEDVRHAER